MSLFKMRISFVAVLCLFSLCEFASAQSPTKEETINFLKAKLIGKSRSLLIPDLGSAAGFRQYDIHQLEVSNDGFLIINGKLNYSLGQSTARVTANLNRVSPDVVVYNSHISLSAANSSAIKESHAVYVNGSGCVQGYKDKSIPKFTLSCDLELAPRVARAISHLIRLSGGKDEPF